MTEIFYRVHDDERPFDAENAWSSQASVPRVAPDRDLCLTCDGTGGGDYNDETGEPVPCRYCGGEGSFRCDRGYSCCRSAEDLIAYFAGHMGYDDHDHVIVFEGERTGTCPDGEPLAVPVRVIRHTTMGGLAAGLRAVAASAGGKTSRTR